MVSFRGGVIQNGMMLVHLFDFVHDVWNRFFSLKTKKSIVSAVSHLSLVDGHEASSIWNWCFYKP